MGELCLVARFGQKCTGKGEKGAGKVENDNLKSLKIEKKHSKWKEQYRLKKLKFYIK
jgi:hypothetical protein